MLPIGNRGTAIPPWHCRQFGVSDTPAVKVWRKTDRAITSRREISIRHAKLSPDCADCATIWVVHGLIRAEPGPTKYRSGQGRGSSVRVSKWLAGRCGTWIVSTNYLITIKIVRLLLYPIVQGWPGRGTGDKRDLRLWVPALKSAESPAGWLRDRRFAGKGTFIPARLVPRGMVRAAQSPQSSQNDRSFLHKSIHCANYMLHLQINRAGI